MEYKSPTFSQSDNFLTLQPKWKEQSYHLEQKDGSLKKFTINLKDNAEVILQGIADALKTTGMSVMKAPPNPDFKISENGTKNTIISNFSQEQGFFRMHSSCEEKRGRDLMHFLGDLNEDVTKSKKASRLDASSAALVARQLYKFQAIDGTKLGWSSASLVKCLASLTKLHDEHHQKFKVMKFYPFRLELTNDECLEEIDLFGGTIFLNAGATQIQWLETLMAVSEASIKQLESNRHILHENQINVQNALNVRIRKGFTCSSKEYFNFLEEASRHSILLEENDESSTAIAPQRIQLVVETKDACRRAVVTPNGELRISPGISIDSIVSSVRKLRRKAWKNRQEEDRKRSQSKEQATLLQYQLGLSKVFKARLNITTEQYLICLEALLSLPEDTKEKIKRYVAGNDIGITGMGRSCHVGDDGSILIPCNWS